MSATWADVLSDALPLKVKTSEAWTAHVMEHFDEFLVDHAAAERKASATCMSYVVKYRDKPELVDAMIGMAREELQHFHQVFKILDERGLQAGGDEKNAYVNALLLLIRSETRLLDKLLISSILEARGAERFDLVSKALPPGSLKEFYTELSLSEARHQSFYSKLALRYFDEKLVTTRLEELLQAEARILEALPLKAALY